MTDEAKERRPKRHAARIRDEIQNALERRPMTVPELANCIETSKTTIIRHLEWLEHLKVVTCYNDRFQNQSRTLWRLV